MAKKNRLKTHTGPITSAADTRAIAREAFLIGIIAWRDRKKIPEGITIDDFADAAIWNELHGCTVGKR